MKKLPVKKALNKKGFTLIETIATLAIAAICISITVAILVSSTNLFGKVEMNDSAKHITTTVTDFINEQTKFAAAIVPVRTLDAQVPDFSAVMSKRSPDNLSDGYKDAVRAEHALQPLASVKAKQYFSAAASPGFSLLAAAPPANWKGPSSGESWQSEWPKFSNLLGDAIRLEITKIEKKGNSHLDFIYFDIDANTLYMFFVNPSESNGNAVTAAEITYGTKKENATPVWPAKPGTKDKFIVYKYKFDGTTMPSEFSIEGTPSGVTFKMTVKVPVSYNANGGFGDVPATAYYDKGADYNISFANIPQRNGYTFLGWSESMSASAPTYEKDKTYKIKMPAHSVVYYAIWRKDETPPDPGDEVEPDVPDIRESSIFYIGDEAGVPVHRGYLYFRRSGDTGVPINVYGKAFYRNFTMSLDIHEEENESTGIIVVTQTLHLYDNSGNEIRKAKNSFQLVNSATFSDTDAKWVNHDIIGEDWTGYFVAAQLTKYEGDETA